MINLILHNIDKYPLDGVVHYELEIDYPFIKDVINYMEAECKRFGIKFYRIKPRRTWEELYKKYGFPTRKARWYCPMSSKINFAYLYKYYPSKFEYMIEKMKSTEKIREFELGQKFSTTSSNAKYDANYLEDIVKKKWIPILNKLEEENE